MITEKEYLKQYNIEEFERPSVTADIVSFTIRQKEEDSYRHDPEGRLSVLLIKRGEHPFKDAWALPGGFLRPGETVEQCALREITEETGITPASLKQIGVFSDPDRDPRGWIISNAFASVISEDAIAAVGGDDASQAEWFDLFFDRDSNGFYRLTLTCGENRLTAILEEKKNAFGKISVETVDSGMIAFDHAEIITSALIFLRKEASNFDAIFDFLPEKFTLTALQKVQETITDIAVLPANFRRKVAEYVEETDEYTTGAGHRPAKLFRRK